MLIGVLGAALGLFAWGVLALRRAWERGRLRRRFRRAARGEQRAVGLLEDLGYRVLAEQPLVQGRIWVDGVNTPFEVRPDLLVRRRGQSYCVEVKTGARAVSPGQRQTRRQLREYAALLPGHRLLLLDVEAGRLIEVAFPEGPTPRRGRALALLVVGVLLGLTLAGAATALLK